MVFVMTINNKMKKKLLGKCIGLPVTCYGPVFGHISKHRGQSKKIIIITIIIIIIIIIIKENREIKS